MAQEELSCSQLKGNYRHFCCNAINIFLKSLFCKVAHIIGIMRKKSLRQTRTT